MAAYPDAQHCVMRPLALVMRKCQTNPRIARFGPEAIRSMGLKMREDEKQNAELEKILLENAKLQLEMKLFSKRY
jgi:hypothetical protein